MRHETLYQRMLSFIENNLLTPDCGISHKGAAVSEIEDLTPSLENLVVLLWLKEVHPNLPSLVKMKFAADLRSQSLASMKAEISSALPSLIEEAKNFDSARVMRTAPYQPGRAQSYPQRQNQYQSSSTRRPFSRNPASHSRDQTASFRDPRKSQKVCPLCKAQGKTDFNHFLSTCRFLPDGDKRFMTKARRIFVDDEPDPDECQDHEANDEYYATEEYEPSPRIYRVNVRSSPRFNTFYGHNPVAITIDTGAETNLIRESVARGLNCPLLPSSQVAFQADGQTPLNVIGETHVTFTRDDLELSFSGLVVDALDVDILAGVPFMEENDVSVRPKKKLVCIGEAHQFSYRSTTPSYTASHRPTILRATSGTTVWPGEYLEFAVNNVTDSVVAIEPHVSSPESTWPAPDFYTTVGKLLRIPNNTQEPQVIKRHAHIGQVSTVFTPTCPENQPVSTITPDTPKSTAVSNLFFSDAVSTNPDKLIPASIAGKFTNLNRQYDDVFNPDYSVYNQALGQFEATVNMGSVKPPQRKGRLPQYSRNKLVELQAEIDRLEALGVFAKPEEINVVVEYLNPSLLVKKPSGKFRLCTAFTEVGKYCKPQPSLMPSVDSTLRNIAQWKYIIKTDLTAAFYQIPLSKSSMKYCGIVSPFKGVRCYTRCAMGMPGSETALEELMCRLVGDLIENGTVTKIADDLYTGGNSPEELLTNWEHLLSRLNEANIKLSAAKTVIAPTQTTILGWIWNSGTIRPDPHKVSSLSTCTPPTTTKGMRSFLGAYKVLSRVIPNCANFLRPLDKSTHGKKSGERISWSDPLTEAFNQAQRHLQNCKSIALPTENDQLWIVTDGASSTRGMGATLYISRDNKLRLAGFFSQQLSPTHLKWFPCEIEGITIAAAVKYFDGFITQSRHRTNVLTDSKPCVEAYRKLLRGQFSSNVRLSTFLSSASRHHICIQHLSGAVNLPSDYQSRQPAICHEPKCQICLFAKSLDESVVRNVTVSDVLEGSSPLPFTSRQAWLTTQSECHDLRRTRAQLMQGTRPSRKDTTAKSVKRYLNKVDLAHDGLIIVKQSDNFSTARELTVVPQQVLPGLLTALHLRLNHPSQNELSKAVKRYFWALNLDTALSESSLDCHTCASLRKVPHALIPQTTSDPPEGIGNQFGADVLRRERQKILVVREYISSYTRAAIIPSEKQADLRSALILLTADLIPLEGPPATVRTDPAPGFQSLNDDTFLRKHRIVIDIGRVKCLNKNPVAERAIQELEGELTRLENPTGPCTPLSLEVAIRTLNARIRSDGLSAREIFFQRDQWTNEQIPVNDAAIISSKHSRAVENNRHSEKSKAKGAPPRNEPDVKVGDIVYVHADRDKHAPRNRYLVTSTEDMWCYIRKFVGNTIRTNCYKVKRSEIYKVPSSTIPRAHPSHAEPPEDQIDHMPDTDKATQQEPTEAPEPVVDTDLPSVPSEIAAPITHTEALPEPDASPVESSPEPAQEPAHPSTHEESPAPEVIHPRITATSQRPQRTRRAPIRLRDYKC